MADVSDEVMELDLDTVLDDIEDLPGFKTFPTGVYRFVFEDPMEEKTVNEMKGIGTRLKLLEVMELDPKSLIASENEKAPEVGDIQELWFNTSTKKGHGFLKLFVTPLSESSQINQGAVPGKVSIRSIMSRCAGVQVLTVMRRTYNEKKDAYYTNVKKVAVIQ